MLLLLLVVLLVAVMIPYAGEDEVDNDHAIDMGLDLVIEAMPKRASSYHENQIGRCVTTKLVFAQDINAGDDRDVYRTLELTKENLLPILWLCIQSTEVASGRQ
jgi:hypothetical protein